ncbi:uncharacterized protein LOC143198385 isoform X2 [Rhynchophorus ferrugineus]|uniref:uncharacterized protein LOC143198385 isoform X2 n=1 Tax=Rhynchophorus ferrugineus TaxID=354439 RepID=UPI003FCDE165
MYYIVLREQKVTDTPQVSELVRNAYNSNIINTFYGGLFNETTFQTMIILSAILFIFFQVKLVYCLCTIPIVLLLMYVAIYAAITMKSAQLMYEKKPLKSWVAEAYEPYFFTKNPNICWYKIITEREVENLEIKPEGKRQIIGTVAVMKHFHHPEWAWLFRLAVDVRYRRKGIASRLVNTVQDWCKDNQFNRIDLAMTECQEGARQLFDKTGYF